jgi:hypothetical protein
MAFICRSDLIITQIDDDLVISNPVTGQFYGLNAMARRIWELLPVVDSEEDLVQRLLLQYEVEPELCKSQVHTLLKTFYKNGFFC